MFTSRGPCMSQSREFIVLLAIITSMWGENSIVTNILYPSTVKQKVKIKGSMVRRKGLIGMVWRERERFQLSAANVELRFLEYIYVCMCVG